MSIPGLEIRPATDADFELVLALRTEAYAEYVVRHFGPWDDEKERAHLKEIWSDRLRVIVRLDGQDIGYFGYIWGTGRVWIGNIILRPESRGRGIGGVLLADFLAWADDHELEAGLQVFEDNPAIRLYERLGFRIDAVDPPHYRMVRPARAGASPST